MSTTYGHLEQPHERFEIVGPNKEVMEMADRLISMNRQIVETNHMMLKALLSPPMLATTTSEEK